MSDRLAPRPLDEPHPRRVAPDHPHRASIVAAHTTALSRGDAGYLDPGTGLFVFTAAHLAAVGTCCGSGCRHCPFVV